MENIHQLHQIPPVYAPDSTILILGSFPSVKSREEAFFYAHPQNRFWHVTSAVFNAPLPQAVEDKRLFLLSHRIALWDVIASCDISMSSDSSIRNVCPNDISCILKTADIRRIFTNGAAAGRLYRKYIQASVNREATVLPSTSPANASWSLKRLTDAWQIISEASL